MRSFAGKELRIKSKIFIICCGGIESARLLLVSDTVEKNGIGNRRDNVGRFFQDHPGIAIPVRPLDHQRFSLWYDSFRMDGIRYCMKFTSSAALQRQKQILHVGGEVYYPFSFVTTAAKMFAGALKGSLRRKRATAPVAESSAAAETGHKIQALPQANVFKRLAMVAQRMDRVARTSFFRRQVLSKVASAGAVQPHLGFDVEQQPNPDSRVMLGQQIDSLGMQRKWFSIGVLTDRRGAFHFSICPGAGRGVEASGFGGI